ncbi:MAG: S-adenosylmethionine:tRNA ribosyltransferase-isomerase, partial [Bacteroidales bacterium]|nr:S-adenosylmethionine:tRNA ribosyltransferase-isomerase [Bacteroidales bacterium]
MTINPENIKIEDFSYELPDIKIAKYPLQERDQSQLLVYNQGVIDKDNFINLDKYIDSNTSFVFNNTKVIQARLKFYKETGAKIEIFCLEPIEPSDYVLAFQETEKITWKCIVGNLKSHKSGHLIKKVIIDGTDVELKATKVTSNGNSQIIEFTWDNSNFSFSEILENIGVTPIPPYLNRDSENIDKSRYQTIYSKQKGSVAAPTAGLHFTESILKQIKSKNIGLEYLTLHVSAGTFKPVETTDYRNHEMHCEQLSIKKESILNLLQHCDHLIAVGTTSLRILESLYWYGVML